jgi:hypothetical protein
MAQRGGNTLGGLVASVLSGSWRETPPALALNDEELNEVAPLLLASGEAALCWRRVRATDFSESPSVAQLKSAQRTYALQSAMQESAIEKVFALLRSAGVEPVLFKGWAIARLYPEKGLRPAGDIDLCVRREDYARACTAVESLKFMRFAVDFEHAEFDDASEMFERAREVEMNGVTVRVPAPEDHLRLLCLHLLRHGAWRPLWLCDVSLAVESRPADFDWERCLGTDARRADWIACAVGLAHRLLGADVGGTPFAEQTPRLPRWLISSVVKQWGALAAVDHSLPEQMNNSLRRPLRLPHALRTRWPDPVRATIRMGAGFNKLPRLPFQIGDYLRQSARLAGRLLKPSREKKS